ncbi:unnamed protein product [Psylliodes chrysocephalus]|uniref:DUF7869 domain-containing protein n=1 Tax=Psylliodes chrysocephalus TaxID=3402493 RepID=A0A9P0CY09_9CUCU|nr:unnamed protein product [Psylliodes chrysocephala]
MNRGKLLISLALNNAGPKNDCAENVSNSVSIEENTINKSLSYLPIFTEDNQEIGNIATESFSCVLNNLLQQGDEIQQVDKTIQSRSSDTFNDDLLQQSDEIQQVNETVHSRSSDIFNVDLLQQGDEIQQVNETVYSRSSDTFNDDSRQGKEHNAEDIRLTTVEPTIIHEENSQATEAGEENTSNSEASSRENTVTTLTKRGTERKRKLYPESLSKRKIKKMKMRANQHNVLPGCKSTCKRMCSELIPEERRQCINQHYWKLSWHEQKMMVLHNSSRNEVKRRSKQNFEDCYKKMSTFKYFFKDKDDSQINVCKTFFLTTLGYKRHCDWIVSSVYSRKSLPDTLNIKDGRGKKYCTKKIPRDDIKTHIMSFHPLNSHYRREHAPSRLYLPSDINITLMHNDFKEKFPNYSCSYDLYRTEVKKMNIAFTKLGNEDCEKCEEYSFHNTSHTKQSLDNDCETCKLWKDHLKFVEYTRMAYQEDVAIANNQEPNQTNFLAISADLLKVIMLPRIDMYKRILFTRRISVYNESFVSLGSQKKHFPLAVLWHEGIAGRKQEEIISAFHAFFSTNRDINQIVMWTDNCTSQNKNWAFITFLIFLINSQELGTEKIHMKYFEPGHSYMSADSFHHQVELSLKKQKKTYDFSDFSAAVQSANKGHVTVKCLNINEIADWKNCSSITKINRLNPRPYLRDVSEMIFTKGKLSFEYRTFENSAFTEVDILQERFKKNPNLMRPKFRNTPCWSRMKRHYSEYSVSSDNEMEPLVIDRGPYFDMSAAKNVTALVGKTTYLGCRIRNLGNRTTTILKPFTKRQTDPRGQSSPKLNLNASVGRSAKALSTSMRLSETDCDVKAPFGPTAKFTHK